MQTDLQASAVYRMVSKQLVSRWRAHLRGELESALRASDVLGLHVDVCSFATTLHEADLLIQIVASADMSAALAQLATLRAASPECAVIVAAVDLHCAQAIHYLSASSGRPWVAVNCGAIPTELTEAELFGHVKGAYTHAHSTRAGLVREAEGGTLFLDEIDSLPYGAQAKLLRFLQDKEYRPVGANQVMRADVRVIAATNRNPGHLAARGVFRQRRRRLDDR